MTDVRALVLGAYRENNLVPVGTEPNAAELVEGLRLFNSLVLSTFGFTVGLKLRDWRIAEQQRTGNVSRVYPLLPGSQLSLVPQYPLYPPGNARIVWDGSPVTAYFPDTPNDGAVMGLVAASGVAAAADQGSLTLDGNGLKIAGADGTSYVSRAAVVPIRWFYRADLADWLTVEAKTIDGESLFPDELDDLWVCSLSIRLAPRYGKEIAPATVERVTTMKTMLRARYQQTEPTPSGGDVLPPAWESWQNNRYSWM